MYAYLWWSTHNKELVDSLEIWYLAADAIKAIDPSEKELQELGAELQSMWSIAKRHQGLSDVLRPGSMRSFGPGGVPSDEAPKMSRCQRCDWSHICPGGEFKDEHPNGGSFHLPGLVMKRKEHLLLNHGTPSRASSCNPNGNRPRITIAEGVSLC